MNGSSSCCPDPPKGKREEVLCSPTDRISQLPQPILHHILSFLTTKDVVCTVILSKTWYHTSTSFPISDFCQVPSFGIMTNDRIHIFLEFVRKSLQSQCQVYGNIPKFKLSMIHHSPYTSIIEDCVQLAIQNNVKELDIKLKQKAALLVFMPQTLFSARELILLSLSDCHLSLPPTHGVPSWPSLRTLSLLRCHVEGLILQKLAFSCPLLESLFLCCCDELQDRDISLSGLTKLTKAEIIRNGDDTRGIIVHIDLPALKTFVLSSGGPCNVDLTACKNITSLRWSLNPMFSSRDLTDLIDGLPALQSLELYWESGESGSIRFSSQRLEKLNIVAYGLVETDLTDLIAGLPALKILFSECLLERISFSSEKLEELHLSDYELVEVSIDAPTLKTFKCSMLPYDLHMKRSSPQEVTINLSSDCAFIFVELRRILGGFKQIGHLKLCLCRNEGWLPAELMDIPVVPALPDIKHLTITPEVEVRSPARADCVILLNGLLWSCRPESMSINFSSYGQFLTKVFCEELSNVGSMEMVNDHTKCGFHGLRSFQIKQSAGNAVARFMSCDAFLELLPTLASEEVEIHFMLEW